MEKGVVLVHASVMIKVNNIDMEKKVGNFKNYDFPSALHSVDTIDPERGTKITTHMSMMEPQPGINTFDMRYSLVNPKSRVPAEQVFLNSLDPSKVY